MQRFGLALAIFIGGTLLSGQSLRAAADAPLSGVSSEQLLVPAGVFLAGLGLAVRVAFSVGSDRQRVFDAMTQLKDSMQELRETLDADLHDIRARLRVLEKPRDIPED